MNILASALFLIIGFLLQTIGFLGVVGNTIPNIILVVIASIGFLLGRKYGLIFGFIGGLMIDIFFGSIIGFYALLYMYVGFMNGFFKKVLFTEDIKLPILLIFASDIVYAHACYIFIFLLKGDFRYSYYLLSVILPEVVFTFVIAVLVYPIMKFVFGKIAILKAKKEDTIE